MVNTIFHPAQKVQALYYVSSKAWEEQLTHLATKGMKGGKNIKCVSVIKGLRAMALKRKKAEAQETKIKEKEINLKRKNCRDLTHITPYTQN